MFALGEFIFLSHNASTIRTDPKTTVEGRVVSGDPAPSMHKYKFTDVEAKRKPARSAARFEARLQAELKTRATALTALRPSLTKPVSVAKFHFFNIVNDRPPCERPDGY
jgi:hypothetical protein